MLKGFLALVLLVGGLFSTVQAQMNGRSIRNNNHRLTLFRGPNLSFPKYKRYNFAGFSVIHPIILAIWLLPPTSQALMSSLPVLVFQYPMEDVMAHVIHSEQAIPGVL